MKDDIIIPSLDDFGLGERFVNDHNGQIFYLEDSKLWIVWDGKKFIKSEVMAKQKAKETILGISDEISQSRESKVVINTNGKSKPVSRNELSAFNKKNCSYSGINKMLKNATIIPEIISSSSKFDIHKHLLNANNGIVDLRTGKLLEEIVDLKTGEMVAHDPSYKMTNISNIDYDPDAQSDEWDLFINNITENNEELKKYLQVIIGYAATGETAEQIIVILVGNGSNGKSKFLSIIQNVLGMYAKATPTETLMKNNISRINTDEARLKGARFVVATEIDDQQKLDEAKVKRLTGNDQIAARFMRQDFFEFTPEFLIFMAVNFLPIVSASESMFRRIVVMPFNAKFSNETLNKNIQEELLENPEAILKWIVDGAVEYYKNGIPYCKEVNETISNYYKSADVIGRFLADETNSNDSTYKVAVSTLYAAYQGWAKKNGEEELAINKFGSLMKNKGFTQGHSGSIRHWNGLNLNRRVFNKR